MRWNCPPTAAASDLTDSVLASPGTPSTSRCPPESRAIAIRSSKTSWPTIVRLTSKSTGCRGLVYWPGDGDGRSFGVVVIGLLRPELLPLRRSYLRPLPWPRTATPAERGADRHREPDAGERVLAGRGGDRDDDADDKPVSVQQRATRAARINRRVELDEPGELAVAGVRGSVKTGDHPGGHAVDQAQRIADGDDGRSHAGATSDGGGHDDLGQLRRGEGSDVPLRVGGGDDRVRRGAVGERNSDGPAGSDDMVRGQDRAVVGHDDASPQLMPATDEHHGRREPLVDDRHGQAGGGRGGAGRRGLGRGRCAS